MGTEPVPPIDDDVARKLRDTFEDDYVAAAQRVINGFDSGDPALDARVRLAVVYLSGGELDRLRRHVDNALIDFRDVLAWAESEALMRLGPSIQPDDPLYLEAQRRDEQRYQTWLHS